MKPDARLRQLQQISQLISDRRLAALQVCAAARNRSLQRLQDLEEKATLDPLEPIAQAQAELRYEAWADARRADINLLLARQTVEWMEARKAAESAYGKASVLQRLIDVPPSGGSGG